LRQPLGGTHQTEAAFAAAAGNVDHRLPRFRFPERSLGAKQMGFVQQQQRRAPQFLGCFHHRFEKQSHEPPAVVHLELVQIEHCRDPQFEQPAGQHAGSANVCLEFAILADQHEINFLAQCGEFSLRIEHDCRHVAGDLLGEQPQQPAFPAAAVRLNQHARIEKRSDVELQQLAVRRRA
jgi:hypothetical protein